MIINVAEDEVEEDYVAEDEVEDHEVEDDDVKGEEDDDVEEEDRSQDRGPHFVRACAVEMHFNISEEPLYTEIYRKNAAAQMEPRTWTHTHTLCEPEQSKCMSTFHKSHLEIYRKNAAAQKRDRHFVRASSIEMHVNMLQEPHYTEIYRKNAAAIRGPDWAQNADTHTLTLCEPAQSKCMSTFHKSHFIRKIKGKMLWPSWSTLIKHQLLHLP